METGGCPHTAIREDASINLAAVADLCLRFPKLELMLIESGGDKIPRKGGPGITRSDLLVINKVDLAPHVGASLAVMDRDARKMRGERPFVFTNVRAGHNVDVVVDFIIRAGGLVESHAHALQ